MDGGIASELGRAAVQSATSCAGRNPTEKVHPSSTFYSDGPRKYRRISRRRSPAKQSVRRGVLAVAPAPIQLYTRTRSRTHIRTRIRTRTRSPCRKTRTQRHIVIYKLRIERTEPAGADDYVGPKDCDARLFSPPTHTTPLVPCISRAESTGIVHSNEMRRDVSLYTLRKRRSSARADVRIGAERRRREVRARAAAEGGLRHRDWDRYRPRFLVGRRRGKYFQDGAGRCGLRG